jgi:DNA polymerase-3 subunit alpha
MMTNNLSDQDFLSRFNTVDKTSHGVELPEIKIDDKYVKEYNLQKGFKNFDFLKSLCETNLEKHLNRIGREKEKQYRDRLNYELELVEELSFTDYFLLIWDFCNFCREKKIPLGDSRGSAGSSLVLFLSKVTKIDPIRYELYFERFISRARAKKTVVDGVTYLDGSLMCDVDIDVDYYRRGETIDYLSEKYKGNVCHILNINTLSSKILIKECGKIVSSKSDQEMTKISSYIESQFGNSDSLEETREKSDKFNEWYNENKRAYNIALKLNGLPRNKGVHASGIVVSKYPLEQTCPIELTKDGSRVSSYNKNIVELLTIKLDVLGVKTLSVVDEVCKIVGINIDDINPEDPYVYQICQDLDSRYGLFQISEDTAYKTTRAIKPRNIEDLSAVLAIARPGALQFIEPYSKYTETGNPPSIHPVLDPHVEETGHMVIYQEQIMRIAHKVFGLSLEDAETIRKGIGKKKIDIINKFEPILKQKCEEKGYDMEVFEIFWKLLHDSASYSFNKCLDPNTLVKTPDGDRKIGDLKKGDKVYSYDPDLEEEVISTVKNTFRKNADTFRYEFDSKETVNSSESHKFMESHGKNMLPIKSMCDYGIEFLNVHH